MQCELCELQEICNLADISSYTIITCEAFKDAVRKYGGKDKVLEEIYNLIKNAVLYKEEKYDINEPFTFD